MIQRTHRSLLSNLSYGFCKGKNFKDTKPEKEKPTNKNIQRNKSKQTSSNKQDVKDTKVQKTQTKNIKKQQDPYVSFSLDKLNVDEAKLQKFKQNNTIKSLFENQHKQNTINQSLIKILDNINEQFSIKMSLYLQKDFFNAKQFYIKNALPAQSNSKQASSLVSSTASQIIQKYIQQDDLQGLLTFTQILINQNKNNSKVTLKSSKILQFLQLILDIQNNLKYKIFSNLIQLANFKSNQPETSKKLQWLLNKTFQKYLKQFQGNQNFAELNKNFDEFLQNFIINVSGKYTKSQLLLKALRALYFGKCNSYQSYDNFFKAIGSFKKITASQDNLFEEFYRNFNYQLQSYRLSTTDCAESAFEVNQQLRQNYDKFVDNKNQLGILSIVAICLDNGDLTIPHEFLQNNSKYFQQTPTKLIQTIKHKYSFLRLLQNTNKDTNSQQKDQLLGLLLHKANNIQKLKLAIAVKDYEKATQIFTNQFFKDNCIQKQRSVIKTVLYNFFYKQISHELKGKQKHTMKQTIQNFVGKLSNEYLWESYKKREDLGYLLEDYYIREGEQSQVTKQQKRFSYWDAYFEIKRALQIKKFEMLGQLDTIRQPNQKPFLQSQFNLNSYLAGQKAERHRQVADYHQKRQSELEMYFNKVEYQLGQLKTSQIQQELKAKIAAYQNSLCEQNLKILQDFGLRGYDITVHDQQQFRNRIKQFHKSRGVFRLQSIYNRIFPNESQFQFLKQEEIRQFKREIKKSQQNKDQESKIASPDQNVQAQEPQAETATQQVSTKQESNQPVLQAQTAAQEQGQQQTQQTQQPQQSQQKPAIIHTSTKDPIKDFLKQTSDLQQLTTEFVDLLRIKRRKQFAEAAINIKTRYLSQVNQLVRWGVLYKQPMAIYMSEKLAMITGQIISHNYAIRVSDYFSYYRQIDQSLLVDCKRCLSYIGKIQRQFIYDTNKVYHHIFYPAKLKNSTFKFNGQLKNRLEDLVIHNPYISRKFSEPRQIERKLRQSRPL